MMERNEQRLSLMDQFFISPLGQWVSDHKNLLLNAGMVVVLVVGWVVFQAVRAPNFVAVQHLNESYAAWKAKPEDEALYRTFDNELTKIPAMRQALRSEVAQRLLSVNRVDEAEKKAQESLRELRLISPDHAEFAEISLLIGRKQYQIALERSVSLKERMKEKKIFYCQNLQRIAFLQQVLNNEAGEWSAWRDLEEFSQNNPSIAVRARKGLENQFVSFQSYIEERNKP
jgi:hypothetical protein